MKKLIIPIILMVLMLGTAFATIPGAVDVETQGWINPLNWFETFTASIFSVFVTPELYVDNIAAGVISSYSSTVKEDCSSHVIFVGLYDPTGRKTAAVYDKVKYPSVKKGDVLTYNIRVTPDKPIIGEWSVKMYGWCYTSTPQDFSTVGGEEVSTFEVKDKDVVVQCVPGRFGDKFCASPDSWGQKERFCVDNVVSIRVYEEDCPSNQICVGQGLCSTEELPQPEPEPEPTPPIEIIDEQSCIDAGNKWSDNQCYPYCKASDSPTYSVLMSIIGMEQSMIVLPGAECTGKFNTFMERDQLYNNKCWLEGECVECTGNVDCSITNCKTNKCDTNIGKGWCWCEECNNGYEPNNDKSKCIKETLPSVCSDRKERQCTGKCHWIESNFISIDWSSFIGFGWSPLGIAGIDIDWSLGHCVNDIVPIELEDIDSAPSSDLVDRVCKNSDWCEVKSGFKVRCLDADKIEEDYDVDIQGFYDEIAGFFEPGMEPGICVAIPKAVDVGFIEGLKETCVWEGKIGEPCKMNLLTAIIIGLIGFIVLLFGRRS